MLNAKQVVDKMYSNDTFSKWMGIKVLLVGLGKCELQMCVTADMLNGFGIAHGGITYSFADSCLAFASNSYGIQAVSIETSISHLAKCFAGDVLTAVAEEVNLTNKTSACGLVKFWPSGKG